MQTIGERLEEARKRKGVSLREAAEATKIRGDYLQKLEANKFDIGLSPIYLRGFLRGYAHYLGLPANKLVSDFDDLDADSSHPGRSVNREVYGRMEFGSAADAPVRAETSTPAADTVHKPASHKPTPRSAPRAASKNLGKLPIGDAPSDRALLLHLLKPVGLVVLVIVAAGWGLSSLVSPKPKTAAAAPAVAHSAPTETPAAPQSAPATQFVIIALDAVSVQVWKENADANYGPVLLPLTTLRKGDKQTVSRTGPVYIQATAAEKIQIDAGAVHMLPGASPYNIKGNQPFELK